jgi:L-methionine (R)-S-oxide reductase
MDDSNAKKIKFYEDLLKEIQATVDGFWLSSLANISAVLRARLSDVNWTGFYLNVNGELHLGPFQGNPACNKIAFGRGVCGKVAQTRVSQLVPDVDKFPDHIVCDAHSKSELVLPLIKENIFMGVIDLDSVSLSRFDETDRQGMMKIADSVAQLIHWPKQIL